MISCLFGIPPAIGLSSIANPARHSSAIRTRPMPSLKPWPAWSWWPRWDRLRPRAPSSVRTRLTRGSLLLFFNVKTEGENKHGENYHDTCIYIYIMYTHAVIDMLIHI